MQYLTEAIKLYTILIFAVDVILIYFRTPIFFPFGWELNCKCLSCSLPCLPISFRAPLLDLLAFWSPLAAHTMDATWSCDSLRLQALRWLLEGKLHCFAFLQAAEAFHVQLALKGEKREVLIIKIIALMFKNSLCLKTARVKCFFLSSYHDRLI